VATAVRGWIQFTFPTVNTVFAFVIRLPRHQAAAGGKKIMDVRTHVGRFFRFLRFEKDHGIYLIAIRFQDWMLAVCP
jgi:hypothetical protein